MTLPTFLKGLLATVFLAGVFAVPSQAESLGTNKDTDTGQALWKNAARAVINAEIDKGIAAYQRRDYATAHKIFLDKYTQEDVRAQYYLGMMYAEGLCVTRNYDIAAYWIHKAAVRGYSMAQTILGFMYHNGDGVRQDYVLAHMWLNLAAAKGNSVAAEARDNITKQMTPHQISQAQELAREWKLKE